jgi:hypothetical protein
MKLSSLTKALILAVSLTGLSACGGDDPGGTKEGGYQGPSINPMPAGFWRGTLIEDGLEPTEMIGMTSPQGEFQFTDSFLATQYFGSGSLIGSEVQLPFRTVKKGTYKYRDEAKSGVGRWLAQLTGTSTMPEALDGVYTLTTSEGTSYPGQINLTFDGDTYYHPSSLEIVTGIYEAGETVLTVSSNGYVYAQDPRTGCSINGNIRVIDERFNVYDFNITQSGCYEDYARLNGRAFKGLASILYSTYEGGPDLLFMLANSTQEDQSIAFSAAMARL